MKRLIKLAVLGAIAYLAWEYVQRMRAEAEDPGRLDPHSVYKPPPSAQPEPDPAPKAEAAPAEPTEPSSPDGPPANASKAELYQLAKELDIKGRSKMSRTQLERAIRDAS
jgi:hypothetical protein